MAVAQLNNTATANTYSEATTVIFGAPRAGFALHVFNAAIMYQVGIANPAATGVDWEPGEHYLVPSLTSFSNPADEGFPDGSRYAGVRVRSATANTPANVTVA